MTPYYRYEYQDEGIYLTVGWPGQWRTRFDARHIENYSYPNDFTVRFTADTQINGRLKPGEIIRAPLISVLMYEKQSEIRTINLWRRWFMDCNMPRQNGRINAAGHFHLHQLGIQRNGAGDRPEPDRSFKMVQGRRNKNRLALDGRRAGILSTAEPPLPTGAGDRKLGGEYQALPQ